MNARLDLLYRGPLESCNFDCDYCPFGKVPIRDDELATDFGALDRFVTFVRGRVDRTFGIFFTPWGEALIHRPYQRAVAELSHLDHVEKVAAQTNGAWPTDWLAEVRSERVGLWLTWHPRQMSRRRLDQQLTALRACGVGHSVGVVGQREHFDAIATLRRELPEETYLWVNANKRLDPPYTDDEIAFLTEVDPLFPFNLHPHASRGRRCGAGETSATVDGDGIVRRCHFLADRIGTLTDLDAALAARTCPAAECRCHIGYVHLRDLPLGAYFGAGILERALPPGWRGAIV